MEVGGEELHIESGAHQDDPEVLVSRQKVTKHDQQEVAEPVPLVNLVLSETAENASSARLLTGVGKRSTVLDCV